MGLRFGGLVGALGGWDRGLAALSNVVLSYECDKCADAVYVVP